MQFRLRTIFIATLGISVLLGIARQSDEAGSAVGGLVLGFAIGMYMGALAWGFAVVLRYLRPPRDDLP